MSRWSFDVLKRRGARDEQTRRGDREQAKAQPDASGADTPGAALTRMASPARLRSSGT